MIRGHGSMSGEVSLFLTTSLAPLTGVLASILISSVKVSDTLPYLGVQGSIWAFNQQ